MSQLTTIAIKKETREMLKKYGTKGETYNDIIKRLIREYKKISVEVKY